MGAVELGYLQSMMMLVYLDSNCAEKQVSYMNVTNDRAIEAYTLNFTYPEAGGIPSIELSLSQLDIDKSRTAQILGSPQTSDDFLKATRVGPTQ